MLNIDEKTRISFFAVLSALPFLIGGILWLTSVDAKASMSLQRSERTQQLLDKQMEILFDMRDSLIRIEEQLKRRSK